MVACIFPKIHRYKLGIEEQVKEKKSKGKTLMTGWRESDVIRAMALRLSRAHLPASPHLDIYSIYTETTLSTPQGIIYYVLSVFYGRLPASMSLTYRN